ncbi:MAG: polymer-forming cytoskeletal protein [Casimicrobiaceae bacterium]
MALWKDNAAPRQPPSSVPDAREAARFDPPAKPELAPAPAPGTTVHRNEAPVAESGGPRREPATAPAPGAAGTRKESLIASDITIEGKIEGGGSVRIAGKFKGDVSVQGDLTIEAGAKLTGAVRADKVTIAGELEGSVEEASRIDLLATGVVIGDLKSGALTVASGARMRGQADFGGDEGRSTRPGRPGSDRGSAGSGGGA